MGSGPDIFLGGKQMRARSLTAILAAVPLFLTATAGAALADTVSDNLDGVIDATAEIMPLNLGQQGTTQLAITEGNGDGKNGCNLTGSTTLVVAVTSSNAVVATVSPSSVTFTSCGDVHELTVHALAEGSSTVSLTQTSNSTDGTFDLAPATFTVNVTAPAPANTAPAVSVSGVTGGAQYAKGSVPLATCDVTDAEDGPSTFDASLSEISGSDPSDGIGSQTASCSYTDKGGLTVSSSATYTIYDPTAPIVTYTLNPASPEGDNGWYKSDVSLTWNVAEPDSPSSVQKTGCEDQTITADQNATDYTCTATSAGGSSGTVTATIKRDGTAPTVKYDKFVDGAPGDHGWYKSDVTVQFKATDATSGFATGGDVKTAVSSGEGQGIVIDSPAFTDLAGNTEEGGADRSPAFNIDKTAPTNIQFLGMADGGSYYYGSVPNPTCTATDAVSGLASCVVVPDDSPTSVGSHLYKAIATDNAGWTSTSELTYTVMAWTLKGFYAPVDMGGVWNTVKNGATVPLKFEVFSDHELTDTSVVRSFAVAGVACPGTDVITDPVEQLATTGGTSLRYDSTAGQFIQNWQTPKKSGACYTVTMTTQDGTSLSANFKLK